MAMATVVVELPSALGYVLDGTRRFEVEADSFNGALAAIRQLHPRLAVHVFQEDGQFRSHVLCFLNEQNTRWLEGDDIPVHSGDTLRFMQAVTGG